MVFRQYEVGVQKAVRIMIAGVPGTGKTTLANKMADLLCLPVVHTDDYLGQGHASAPGLIYRSVKDLGYNCIIEGTQVARMLRNTKDYFIEPSILIYCRDKLAEARWPQFNWVSKYTKDFMAYRPNLVHVRWKDWA